MFLHVDTILGLAHSARTRVEFFNKNASAKVNTMLKWWAFVLIASIYGPWAHLSSSSSSFFFSFLSAVCGGDIIFSNSV